MGEVFKSGPIELRLGRWQDVLADAAADACITDPPYGSRTHKGHAGRTRNDIRDPGKMPAPLPYQGWSPADVQRFVNHWAPCCGGWFVAMTSHDLQHAYQDAFADNDLYPFAPIPMVARGMSIRLSGDGPSSWTCWIMIAARPKSFSKWGTLPGAYMSRKSDSPIPGGKNLEIVRQIVRDYTRPGDLVIDPCAGGATTLIAAAIEGRRAVGSEVDPETFAAAVKRIKQGYTPDLFSGRI